MQKIIIQRKCLLLMIFVLLSLAGYSQYTVTKIVGLVTNKTTGELLKPGSKLRDDDMLEFSSERDLIRVIVSGKGVYVISPTPRRSSSQSAIVEMLKTALKLKSREGYLSGRSEEFAYVPESLNTETAVNNRLLITEETRYLFDRNKYPVKNGNRFFLQIESGATQPQIRALTTVGDTILMRVSDFARSGNDENARYKLGFFNKEMNSSESIANIRPYLDTTGEMTTILTVLIKDAEEKDAEKLKQLCYAEIYEALGKPSQIDFDRTFEKLIAQNRKRNTMANSQ